MTNPSDKKSKKSPESDQKQSIMLLGACDASKEMKDKLYSERSNGTELIRLEAIRRSPQKCDIISDKKLRNYENSLDSNERSLFETGRCTYIDVMNKTVQLVSSKKNIRVGSGDKFIDVPVTDTIREGFKTSDTIIQKMKKKHGCK